jgi:hypothetical protein
VVVNVPVRAMAVKRSSVATCHSTAVLVFGMPPRPSALRGFGARRVQITNPSAAGSPDATPRVNG